MKTLTDFLKEQAERERGQPESAQAVREEWVAAVDRLILQMTEWLRQADQDGVLTIQFPLHTRSEEGIGFYEVSGLSIRLGARQVRVEPVARKVVGPFTTGGDGHRLHAQGRVDLIGDLRQFMLYRFIDQDEIWTISDDQDYSLRGFDRTAFEDAIQRLLE